MTTVIAVVKKGIPYCPQCETKYDPSVHKQVEYGVREKDYYFKYCCLCSTKKNKILVEYLVGEDFKVIDTDMPETVPTPPVKKRGSKKLEK